MNTLTRLIPLLLLPLLLLSTPADASFHLMQIERIFVGLDGDDTVQAIQLRMRSSFQNQVQASRLVAWDANGANPVVLIAFPTPVSNQGVGVRILAGSSGFAALTSTPDFVMTNLIPASYFAAGSLTFENSTGTQVVWRFSWGGASYTGPTSGTIDNDADGVFSPNYPAPLDPSAAYLVRFGGAAGDLSTNNAADYVSNAGATATFRDNNNVAYTLESTPTASPLPVLGTSRLLPNAPNPFGRQTTLRYALPVEGPVVLSVFDVRGRRVAILDQGVRAAGVHEIAWDARDRAGRDLPQGVYHLRLQTTSESVGAKVMIAR